MLFIPKVNISRVNVCMMALSSLMIYHYLFLSRTLSASGRGLTLTKTLIEFAIAPVEDCKGCIVVLLRS